MTRRQHRRAARLAAVAMLAVGWASMLSIGPASGATDDTTDQADAASTTDTTEETAPELVTFGLMAASGGVPDTRGYLTMTAAPGSVIYDSVAVINRSDTALDLDLYAADAENAADGSLALLDRAEAAVGAGSWIRVDRPRVTVPGQSRDGQGYTIVPVAVSIPADAEPGEHLAGVVASLTATGTATGEGQSATVDLEQRVGLRVYVNVAGETHGGLTITDVQAEYHQADLLGLAIPGSATVTYTLTNTGNTRLNVSPTAVASGIFGLGEARVAGPMVEELLPGSSVTQTVELDRVWPTIIQKVTVSATATAPLAGTDPGIGTPSASVWMWALPWAYLAILLLLVAAVVLLRRRRKAKGKRRRGRHAPTTPGPEPPTPVAEEAKQPQTVP